MKINILEKDLLKNKLQFMSLFISVYESFEDYLIKVIDEFFHFVNYIYKSGSESDYVKMIKEEEERQKQEKTYCEKAVEKMKANNEDLDENSDIYIYANYDYEKITKNGTTYWRSPKYNKFVTKRLLTIDGKKQDKPVKVFNSFMFFVDSKAVNETEFKKFIEIRNKRNAFVHEMPEILVNGEISDYDKKLFDSLISLYIKINNFWAIELELGIAGEDMPEIEKYDYENIITNDLYFLLLSLDIILDKDYVSNDYDDFIGLYDALKLPIKK